jgi:formate/nitrite transporter FocA (FNT family)
MKADDRKAKERADAEERSSPSGRVIYEAILQEGMDELERPSSALFWSGIAAGLSMGASLIGEGLLGCHLPNADWKPLVTKLGYGVGFVVVILGRQQLFTENTLTPVLPLMREKTVRRFAGVMRLWGIVLAANLLGCLAVAWVTSLEAVFSQDVRLEFAEIGRQAMEGSFGAHIMRGVFAGG